MSKGGQLPVAVAVLTGGSDRPYVFGLVKELISRGVVVDLIGSDELDFPEFRDASQVRLFKLRGEQHSNAGVASKVFRICAYYARLVRYAAMAKPRVFHVLWNNKFELFDRTILMLYYRMLNKRVVLTAHNVNLGRRNSKDTFFNRFTLRIQYRLADCIFVHTQEMQLELIQEFGAQADKVRVIPFGINNQVPSTSLSPNEAKGRLGLPSADKTILFFGKIRPYKGLEYLVEAFLRLAKESEQYRMVIAGKPGKGCEKYWEEIQEQIRGYVQDGRILVRTDYVPDDEVEVYFKAADVMVLPYRSIYQSGVLFLGYNFGLPALAADVGSLKEDVIEGETGFVFKPEDPIELAAVIERYFASDLYKELGIRRDVVRSLAVNRHSWEVVGQATTSVYTDLIRTCERRKALNRQASTTPHE
ncbi:MAG TPA: glycosyltransferase family 4 protein [Candidatus Acidoferrum sp.]